MSKKTWTIIQALMSANLFGSLPEFKNLSSWSNWIVWLKALFGLPMDDGEFATFRKCTGWTKRPMGGFKESSTIVGRRGGKSKIAAAVAVFIAFFVDFAHYLSTGEVGMVLVLGRDKDQAKVVFNYCKGIIQAIPTLRAKVVAFRTDEIELTGGIVIAVKTSDYRSVRGVTIVCVVADEIAFWNQQGVNPDSAVFSALRPAMATIPEAKMICISTGYAQAGVLYDTHKKFFGKDNASTLVWQADTRTMNPNVSQAFIDKEIAEDPAANSAEYLGTFRTDLEAAFPRELIESCIIPGRVLLPYSAHENYFSFNDVCGGRHDWWVQAIGHSDGKKVIVDHFDIWKPPLDTSETAQEAAVILKQYGLTSTIGDAYAGAWPESEFAKHGISYTLSEKNKSQLYLELIPILSSRQCELPDDDTMLDQFRRLERRRGKAGKDSIDHPNYGNARDDVANCIAGLVVTIFSGEIGEFFVAVGGGVLPIGNASTGGKDDDFDLYLEEVSDGYDPEFDLPGGSRGRTRFDW